MKIKEVLAQLPQFLALLINLLKDSRVSTQDKVILATVVAYALNPVDLVPDWIPFFGLVDDIYLIALSIVRLLARVDEAVLRDNWHGKEDVILTIKRAIDASVQLLPTQIRRALVAKVDKEAR